MMQGKKNKAGAPLGDEVHFKGVWKMPSGSYTTEIKDPVMRKNMWLGTFNTAEEAVKAYDTAARQYDAHTAKTNFPPNYLQTTTRDFLWKLNHNNVMSDHILPNQTSDIASSSRSGGDMVMSFPLPNQNVDEFHHFMTVTGASIVMSTVRDKDLLESLTKVGVILPDPKMSSQKETLNFMSVGAVQLPSTSAEPPNLELSLAPPGSI